MLGCIADDLTGATDLAGALARHGRRVDLVVGVPEVAADATSTTATTTAAVPDAVVVALKSRTAPVHEAIVWSVTAAKALGADQLYFKYCSTFDSTPRGNIGPVADALLDFTGAPRTVHCPAYPVNGRTVYFGNLFVNGRPLSESPMRDHPLTPMTDSDLVRWLSRQTPHEVGLLPWTVLDKGVRATAKAIDQAPARHLVADALHERHLRTLGAACRRLDVACGATGLGVALFEKAPSSATRPDEPAAVARPSVVSCSGAAAVVSGSLSAATREQVARWPHRARRLDEPIDDHLDDAPLLVHSIGTADHTSDEIERGLARVAVALVREHSVRRLIVAGGETAGAVVAALGIHRLQVGAEIAPGVPWCRATTDDGVQIALALKSGNFGGPDFFVDAFASLDGALPSPRGGPM